MLRPWQPLQGQSAAAALCLRPRRAAPPAPPSPPLPLLAPLAPLPLLQPLLPALLQPLLASSSAELDAAAQEAWGYNQTTVAPRAHAAAHGVKHAELKARAPPPRPMTVAGDGELRHERRWRRLLLLSTDPADAAAVCTSVHRLLEVSKYVVRR